MSAQDNSLIAERAPVRVMAHLVAGFPDTEIARAAARGLAEGGVSCFEIQLPFSDPSADGPAIQGACASVLERGYRVQEGLAFVSELRATWPDIPVYIMTYANLAFHAGIERFVENCRAAGVSGLIIPDLPFDSDEGLSTACTRHGLINIPVAAPSMSEARLKLLANQGFPLLYAALRAGITGQKTEIDGLTRSFLAAAGAGGSRLLGGFGIRTAEQSQSLSSSVYAVVAGSIFVETIAAAAPAGSEAVRVAVAAKARELTGKK